MMSIISKIFGLPSPYLLAIFAVLLALAGYGGWHEKSLRDDAALVAAQTRVINEMGKSEELTAKQSVVTAAQVAQIQTVTQTIVKEVKVYVSPKADAQCVVPTGLVRMLNAAGGLPGLSDPATRADDTPAGIAISDVGTSVAGNYGTYQELAAKYVGLQNWVRGEKLVGQVK